MPLTKRQREILDYLGDFIADNGYAPSFDEIRQDFGYASRRRLVRCSWTVASEAYPKSWRISSKLGA
ncbi:MAG: hypothetical protein OXG18_03285 [Gemmatimonadetes bacterium]|nr:hypothetical protein [Gemmatimonadota bacterium]